MSDDKKTHPVNFRFQKWFINKLKKESKDEGKSMSKLMQDDVSEKRGWDNEID